MKPATVTKEFVQGEDCCGRVGEFCQTLTVATADGGGGSYIVLTTERWAIDPDQIEAFVQMLRTTLTEVAE